MDLKLFKILSALGLWAIALIAGLMPILIRNFKSNKVLISLSQCFAGGLFIAIGLIHILPEARENLEGRNDNDLSGIAHDHHYFPLSLFICLITFSLIMFLDKVVFNNTDLIDTPIEQSDFRHSVLRKSMIGDSDDPEDNFKERVSHNVKLAMSLSKMNIEKKHFTEVEEEGYLTIADEKGEECKNEINKPKDDLSGKIDFPSFQKEEFGKKQNEELKTESPKQQEEGNIKLLKSDINNQKCKTTDVNFHRHLDDKKEVQFHHNHDHHGHHHANVKKGSTYFAAMFILTAMGIHSLFEGLALGVEENDKGFINMLIAIFAHKWCDSLVVGFSFVNAELSTRMSIMLILFLSLFTPLGIFIGFLGEDSKTLTGVFQSISAGTFIYISCGEIIVEEFSIATRKYLKFLMYAFGIAFVTLMTSIEHKE